MLDRPLKGAAWRGVEPRPAVASGAQPAAAARWTTGGEVDISEAPAATGLHPLTPDRWDDLVELFGPERGASCGCWCMWWRMPRAEWKIVPRDEKRDRFRAVVEAGPPPGVMAYLGEQPVGW